MATKQNLQELALLRLEEAETLFTAGFYDGCAYLCGYVVELALKARICKVLDRGEYPDKGGGRLREALKTHNFDELRMLAAMEQALSANNPALFTNWSTATEWKPERRYEPKGTYNQAEALKILDAIRDPSDGVLACIRSRW